MLNTQLLATLCPSFSHFNRFRTDTRLAGIRVNPAAIPGVEFDREMMLAFNSYGGKVPLYFDVKSRQMRVAEVHENENHLDITLNHAISVQTPTEVLFKAGADFAVLHHLEEGGKRLIFQGGPQYNIYAGESLHIRHPSLKVHGPIFTPEELTRIETAKRTGFERWFLSYVEAETDVDQFLELVGKKAEVWLKIESPRGLEYVRRSFNKKLTPNLVLVAARGDMYVELERPHEILGAMQQLIQADPEACVGSRLLLSLCSAGTVVTKMLGRLAALGVTPAEAKKWAAELFDPVPSCADWNELAWLYDVGFRRFLLCDELCLEGKILGTAVNAFEAFRGGYQKLEQHKETERRRSLFESTLQWLGS